MDKKKIIQNCVRCLGVHICKMGYSCGQQR